MMLPEGSAALGRFSHVSRAQGADAPADISASLGKNSVPWDRTWTPASHRWPDTLLLESSPDEW